MIDSSLLDRRLYPKNVVDQIATLKKRIAILEDMILGQAALDARYTLSSNTATTVTADYTATVWETVRYNPSGGTFTITLPAGPADGDRVYLANVSTGSTPITVDGGGYEVAGPDGDYADTITLDGDYMGACFQFSTKTGEWDMIESNRTAPDIGTLPANDTTPTLAGGRYWKTANTSATTITDFDDMIPGEIYRIKVNDNNTTFDFNPFSSQLRGNGGSNFTAGTGDHLILIYDGALVYAFICNIA